MSELVTLEDVRAAADRLEGVVHRTPIDSSSTIAERAGAAAVHLKLENLQRAGSFKLRGAYNRISRLTEPERAAGVVTVSAGNHAQGVALAARIHGVDATVVMPEHAPAAKVDATEGYGARVVQEGASYAELKARADRLIEDQGLTMVHPFADPAVIAGQGTLGLELVQQAPAADVAVVPIGGGGLASGVGVALAETATRVVAVETEGTAHAARAMADGEVHVVDEIDTIAEGIAAGQTEPYTLAHLRAHVDEVVSVTDADARAAMALLAERAKVVAEPAGALPVAALLSGAIDAADESVVAVVSGGNVDLEAFCRFVRAGAGD
ncbi:MAG: threonine/serine dehydratase [Halobacteriales archaeon]|nr:threonine/serine dehydratase [Halobacteriales archaeon]